MRETGESLRHSAGGEPPAQRKGEDSRHRVRTRVADTAHGCEPLIQKGDAGDEEYAAGN